MSEFGCNGGKNIKIWWEKSNFGRFSGGKPWKMHKNLAEVPYFHKQEILKFARGRLYSEKWVIGSHFLTDFHRIWNYLHVKICPQSVRLHENGRNMADLTNEKEYNTWKFARNQSENSNFYYIVQIGRNNSDKIWPISVRFLEQFLERFRHCSYFLTDFGQKIRFLERFLEWFRHRSYFLTDFGQKMLFSDQFWSKKGWYLYICIHLWPKSVKK